jgi:hypothetical protein
LAQLVNELITLCAAPALRASAAMSALSPASLSFESGRVGKTVNKEARQFIN